MARPCLLQHGLGFKQSCARDNPNGQHPARRLLRLAPSARLPCDGVSGCGLVVGNLWYLSSGSALRCCECIGFGWWDEVDYIITQGVCHLSTEVKVNNNMSF